MTCNDCKELVDVLVSSRTREATGVDAEIGRCPECESDHVSPCVAPMPCPKCGGKVELDEKGGVTCWD